MEGSRACSDFKLFYDTGKITHHDRSPNWYIDMPPQTITVRELSDRCGFGKETNKLKHWLGLKVFPLIEDPLGFYFLRHLDGAIEDLHEGKSSKRLRYAKAACSQVVLEAKVRESAARLQDNVGAVVRRKMGRTITTVRSDEDSSEEKHKKWVKLSETMW
jgi:hypothetical protein